jgi:hypothetical protein
MHTPRRELWSPRSSVVRFSAVAASTLFFGAPVSHAIEMDGGLTIRLADGAGGGECINASKDAVSLHLRRMIVSKREGFFSEDTQIAVVLETRLQGRDASENETTIVQYPRAFRTNVSNYGKGLVSVPAEIRILTRYPLSQPGIDTLGIDLDFELIRKKGKGSFGVAIEHLADVSQGLVPPANPYGKAFGYFANYAMGLVDASIADKNVVDSSVKEGRLALTLSGDDICTGDEERTGTIVVIKAFQGGEPGEAVDIAKPDAYCWKAKYQPNFSVEFAAMPPGGCQLATTYKSLVNPHYMFILNASRENRGEAFVEGAKRLDTDAEARCRWHGIPLAMC